MIKKILLWVFTIPVLGLQGIFFLSLMESPKPMVELPKPQYHPQDSDPGWLAQAVQFHGHLGPWATAGIRFGAAARGAVGAQGYFDLEVRCQGPLERPPRSCFLDGLQVGTGATLGKRNLHWESAEELVVWVKNTRTGQTAEVRPTKRLMEMLSSLQTKPKTSAAEHDHEEDDSHDQGAAPAAKMDSTPSSEKTKTSPTDSSSAVGRGESTPQSSEDREDPVETLARQIAALPDGKILKVKILPAP